MGWVLDKYKQVQVSSEMTLFCPNSSILIICYIQQKIILIGFLIF